MWPFTLRDEWRIAEEPFTADRHDAVDDAFAIMRGDFPMHSADPGYRAWRAAAWPGEQRGKLDLGGWGHHYTLDATLLLSMVRTPHDLLWQYHVWPIHRDRDSDCVKCGELTPNRPAPNSPLGVSRSTPW